MTDKEYIDNFKTLAEETNYLCYKNWTLDIHKRLLITSKEVIVHLTIGEFDLLMIFIAHPQETLSRDQLTELTKHRQAGPFDRSIDMQVSRLRQKIERRPKRPEYIKTMRDGGYRFYDYKS